MMTFNSPLDGRPSRSNDGKKRRPYDRPMTMAEIAATTDADIDFSDIPECDETFWEHAKRIEPDGVYTPPGDE